MPRRDGTGPISSSCNGTGLGLGSGYRRGPGKNFANDLIEPKKKKELLQKQKELLERKLDDLNKQIMSQN